MKDTATSILLTDINKRAIEDASLFVRQSEAAYNQSIEGITTFLKDNQKNSPIVLLTGPSGSGKTTTAFRIKKSLEMQGIYAHTISMDDYYKARNTCPSSIEDCLEEDLESPNCMDLHLLGKHLEKLAKGEEIYLPKFDFVSQIRHENTRVLQMKQDEMVIIEGIHALNNQITAELNEHAMKIYVWVGNTILAENGILTPQHIRFVRRAIRDENYRNASYHETLQMWTNVCKGEKQYIKPYFEKADIVMNSFLPYELCVFVNLLTQKLKSDEEALSQAGMHDLYKLAESFETIDFKNLMPEDSLLHEFIK